jgi:hypothetical protein
VCTVSSAEVRPFWGRAYALVSGTLLGTVATAVLVAFCTFRAIGYRVPLHVIAWPPAWHRIDKARADYFYRLARTYLEKGDIRGSYLALNQVHSLDPGNIAAAELLAQFAELGNPDFSDSLFRQLVDQPGPKGQEAAELWFRALMARGEFHGVAWLSAHMIAAGSDHYPAWLQALVFATEHGAGPSEARGLVASKRSLPADVRSVLALELEL